MIQSEDPYRAWVYSLKGATLDAAIAMSVPPSQWDALKQGLVKFLNYEGWPLKLYQGTITLARTSAGNLEHRFEVAWYREAFGPTGNPVDPKIMSDHANGPDIDTALARLWLLAVENMRREMDQAAQWTNHMRTYMRPIAFPFNPGRPTIATRLTGSP